MNKYIIIAFATCALIVISTRNNGSFGVETDWYGCYGPQAKAIQSGHFILDDYRGPLYPAVVALTGSITGADLFQLSMVLSVVFASTLLFVLALIMTRLGLSDKAAAIGLLILVTNQTFFDMATRASTDMMFAMICVLTCYAIICKRPVVTGLLIAAAFLTRLNGLVLIAPAMMMDRRVYAMIPVVVAVAAWGVVTYSITGTFLHNHNYVNTANLLNPNLAMTSLAGVVSGWSDLINTRTLVAVLDNSVVVIWGAVSSAMFLPIALIGGYGVYRSEHRMLFMLMIVPALAVSCLVPYSDRYALPLLPWLSVGVAQWLS